MSMFASAEDAANNVGESLQGIRKVTIVVPDATRPLDYTEALRALLGWCDAAHTQVIVGLGLHRAMLPDEIAHLREICDAANVQLLQHDPFAEDMKHTSHDPPGWYAPAIVEADVLVSIGVVEPHQYAGFSGGAKGVVIGCGGAKTIAWMHSLQMLKEPGVELGNIHTNPFQSALWRVAESLPPIWGIYKVSGTSGWFSGPARQTFEEACEHGSHTQFMNLDASVQWLRLKVPASKASNFYQASRAATYAALVRYPAVSPGGWIFVEAPCPEGFGSGSGERAAALRMQAGTDALLALMRSENPPETQGGEQRAFVLAMALERFRIALIGAPRIPELSSMGIPQFATFEEASSTLNLSPAGLIVENPFLHLPRLQSV